MEEIPANESILHFEIMKTSVLCISCIKQNYFDNEKVIKECIYCSFTKIGCEAQ